MNLLIVDDYPVNRRLLRAQLEGEGHTVHEASNGVEALALLEQEDADAVISDILMPNMDGFRLCCEIRKHPRLGALPLILYTSTYNSPSDRDLAQTVGADCYVLKPAPTAVLMQAVAEAQQKAARRTAVVAPADDSYVLKQYNEALVRKLEERNAELLRTVGKLTAAHEEIFTLNRNLETRVAERTAALDVVNSELESFSYSVAHDLRAPLRHINSFAFQLEESAAARLASDDLQFVRKIAASAKEMSELIDHLLEFSRFGKVELQLGPVDLNVLVDKAIAALANETLQRRIVWIRHPLPVVVGDAALLRQVLANLLGNAVKYTRPRAEARIEIGVEPGPEQQRVIFVRDNGVGFDMQYASKLFGVFQRLHSSREFEGTGVGLANVQRIIARHGGRVWADSALDQGATFRFTLQQH